MLLHLLVFCVSPGFITMTLLHPQKHDEGQIPRNHLQNLGFGCPWQGLGTAYGHFVQFSTADPETELRKTQGAGALEEAQSRHED